MTLLRLNISMLVTEKIFKRSKKQLTLALVSDDAITGSETEYALGTVAAAVKGRSCN